METSKSTGRFWFYFLIAFVALIFMCIVAPKFFWITLPFVFTFFVRAMNIL